MSEQSAVDNSSPVKDESQNIDTPTKRTPKRKSHIERIQEESKEILKNMGVVDLSETRSTRRSTRSSTNAVSPPAVTTTPKRQATTPSTSRRGGRKKKTDDEITEVDETPKEKEEESSPKVTPPPRKRQKLVLDDKEEEKAVEQSLEVADEPDSSAATLPQESNGEAEKMDVDEEIEEKSESVPVEENEAEQVTVTKTKTESIEEHKEEENDVQEVPSKKDVACELEPESQSGTASTKLADSSIKKIAEAPPQEAEKSLKVSKTQTQESEVEAMEVDSSVAQPSAPVVEEIQDSPKQAEGFVSESSEVSEVIQKSPSAAAVEEPKDSEISSTSERVEDEEIAAVKTSTPSEVIPEPTANVGEVLTVEESAPSDDVPQSSVEISDVSESPDEKVTETLPEFSEVSSEVVNQSENAGEPTQVFEISSDNQDSRQVSTPVIDSAPEVIKTNAPEVAEVVESTVTTVESSASSEVIEKQVEAPAEDEPISATIETQTAQ